MLTLNNNINFISSDIGKLKSSYKNCVRLESKQYIKEKMLFMKIKKVVLSSNYKPIKDAYYLIKSENIELIKDALSILDSADITYSNQVSMHLFKALLLELSGDFTRASKEYNTILRVRFSQDIFDMYKEFVSRANEFNRDMHKLGKIKKSKKSANNLLKGANSIEKLAKTYIKDSSTALLAQNYYRRVITIHKDLYIIDQNKYIKNYIMALIKGVETYNISKDTLDEARDLTIRNIDCQITANYLLNKIYSL